MKNIDKIPVEYNESCIEPSLRKSPANGLCVEPTDQRALSDLIAFLNVHYDQSVRFCTDTERSADSTECTCIGDISFSSVTSRGNKSAGFIIINQSKGFYRTATTEIKALT